MIRSGINSLRDLEKLRTAPEINLEEAKNLKKELLDHMLKPDWFTVGSMAPSSNIAINVIRGIENNFNWSNMNISNIPSETGPVFLKANQKTNEINLRVENGLGEGILISCQHNEESKDTQTFGPLPLTFFKNEFI